jgi:hypothetical protein
LEGKLCSLSLTNEKPGKENENIFGNTVDKVVGTDFFTNTLYKEILEVALRPSLS